MRMNLLEASSREGSPGNAAKYVSESLPGCIRLPLATPSPPTPKVSQVTLRGDRQGQIP